MLMESTFTLHCVYGSLHSFRARLPNLELTQAKSENEMTNSLNLIIYLIKSNTFFNMFIIICII